MEQGCYTFDEKQRLTDLLSSEKFLTGVYNTYCCEASTGAVKSCLWTVLEDEHRIHGEIFDEMQTRGYYTVEAAENTKLNETKQTFSQGVTV